jgi:hypothetical protein
MKQIIILFSFVLILFAACNNDDDEIRLEETGTVINYAGAGNCGFVIELENGAAIQPLYFPDGFNLYQGQRVHLQYVELTNIIPSCDKGTPAEIVFIEELNCTPYVDLYFSNYDSLERDPVFIQDAFVDGNCLQILVSFSGGCEDHTIDLARMHPWQGNVETIPNFEIRHNANGDMCEAWFTNELRYDLTPLIDEGKKEFVLTAKLTDGTVYNQIFKLK